MTVRVAATSHLDVQYCNMKQCILFLAWFARHIGCLLHIVCYSTLWLCMAFLIHRYEYALFYDLKRLTRALESVKQTDLPVILSPAYEVTLESVCRFVFISH